MPMSTMAETAIVRGADWFTSSYSNDLGGNCVEGARIEGRGMAVRDSKDAGRGAFVVRAPAWQAFLDDVKAGVGAGAGAGAVVADGPRG